MKFYVWHKINFPLASSQLIPGFRLKFADSEINLTNFYRAYLTTPEHFEKNITTALATILQINEWGTAQTEPELIEIQDRIMPHSDFERIVGTEFSELFG